VLLTDTLPADVAFGGWVQNDGAGESDGVLTWAGAVAADESLTLVYTATHTGGYGENFSNDVAFTYGEENGSASASTTILGAPVLGVAKRVDDATPDEGDSVTYTVVVSNTGTSEATGVTVTDSMSGTLASGVTLAAGETVTYTYSLTTDDGPQTLENIAGVSSAQT